MNQIDNLRLFDLERQIRNYFRFLQLLQYPQRNQQQQQQQRS